VLSELQIMALGRELVQSLCEVVIEGETASGFLEYVARILERYCSDCEAIEVLLKVGVGFALQVIAESGSFTAKLAAVRVICSIGKNGNREQKEAMLEWGLVGFAVRLARESGEKLMDEVMTAWFEVIASEMEGDGGLADEIAEMLEEVDLMVPGKWYVDRLQSIIGDRGRETG
jgi:hypothetical protein